ncbi:acyl-CoA dehydrogenase family protein [Paraburkholderia nodosa]|uniref:hypothetical protein n=1 Tax=Paraburkholderia nodosa TaxID=392320 RepID=UPI000487C5C8|nr:hypothetical protein [Paraburkholderia nodosa]
MEQGDDQGELGRIEADVRAARPAMQVQAESHWRHALAASLNDQALYSEGIQTGIWIATICSRAAHACFTLSGGAAMYESSPLQWRLRDLQAAAQHAMVHQRHYAEAGRMLLEPGRINVKVGQMATKLIGGRQKALGVARVSAFCIVILSEF